MKRLLITLLIALPIWASAQNWKSVRMNDTTYYTIPAANDYLRVIWIDSATVSGTDSIFHFYSSIRLGNTTGNCLDTLGPTWLGKNFIKKANGDELFFNRWLDTIVIKPTSALNTTWLMHTDTSNNEYRATITAIDTLTVDNQLDSIKELTIEVFNNNVPITTNVHHNKKMILSKAHGFVECLEWYGFPEIPSSLNLELFENYTEIHQRLIDNGLLKHGNRKIDIHWKYQTGNVWQYEQIKNRHISTSNWNRRLYIREDSVINVQTISFDSLLVTMNSKIVTKWTKSGSTDTFVVSNFMDTSLVTSSSYSVQPILPERFPLIVNYYASLVCNRPMITTVNNGCDALSINIPCIGISHSNSACVIKTLGYWGDFGETSEFYQFPGAIAGAFPPYDTQLKYAKVNNCEFGLRFPIWPLSLQYTEQERRINTYPNPTSNKIYFNTKDNPKTLNAKLFSIQGKLISSCEDCNEINTSDFTNGLYLLNIETDKGIVRKKIIIQH